MKKPDLQKIAAKIPRDQLARYRVPWWIDPQGDIVHLQDKDHAMSAIEMLKERGIKAGPEKSISTLIHEGWVRVQAYPDHTAFVQGTLRSLLDKGSAVLKIVPELISVEIAYIPADYTRPPSVPMKEIGRMGWQEAVRHAERVGKSGKKARK